MSSVIAWPTSSWGMLMELFGSSPLEAGGMDLFHYMSVWGRGGGGGGEGGEGVKENYTLALHQLAGRGRRNKQKKDGAVFHSQDKELSTDSFGGLFQSNYLSSLAVVPLLLGRGRREL